MLWLLLLSAPPPLHPCYVYCRSRVRISRLPQIKAHNLSPALQWAQEHRSQLSPDGSASKFEFRLHALTFLTLLTSKGQAAALAYAQQHFGPFKVGLGFRLFPSFTLTVLKASLQPVFLYFMMADLTSCLVVCFLGLVLLQGHHMHEIQRLMGCLLFVDRPPAETPYADLLSPTRWDEVAQDFARQACSLMGQVGLGSQGWMGACRDSPGSPSGT